MSARTNYRLRLRQLKEIIDDAALSAKKHGIEICGLLVDNSYFIELVRLRNKNRRGGGFAFYTSEVRAIEKASNILHHEIVGTFHSHPAYLADPSDSDVSEAIDDSLMLVVDVIDRKAALWHIKNQKKKRLDFQEI